MRWRTRQIGDIRTVHRFLLWPRSTYRRVRPATTTDPAGVVSKEKESRFLEWAWIRQQWSHRHGVSPPGWIDISWENGFARVTKKCETQTPLEDPRGWKDSKTRRCEIGPPS